MLEKVTLRRRFIENTTGLYFSFFFFIKQVSRVKRRPREIDKIYFKSLSKITSSLGSNELPR